MPDGFVHAAIKIARDGLPDAKLPDGNPVGEETPAQKAKPLIPFAEARDVVNAGAASGFAAWCGVDWEMRNFLPLMSHAHDAAKRPAKVVTFIALLHGAARDIVHRDIGRAGPCAPEDRAAIDDYLNTIAKQR